MSKVLIYLISFVLLLGLAGSASAELVAHWKFDEVVVTLPLILPEITIMVSFLMTHRGWRGCSAVR